MKIANSFVIEVLSYSSVAIKTTKRIIEFNFIQYIFDFNYRFLFTKVLNNTKVAVLFKNCRITAVKQRKVLFEGFTSIDSLLYIK